MLPDPPINTDADCLNCGKLGGMEWLTDDDGQALCCRRCGCAQSEAVPALRTALTLAWGRVESMHVEYDRLTKSVRQVVERCELSAKGQWIPNWEEKP